MGSSGPSEFDTGVQAELVKALKEMRAGLDPKKEKILYNQLGRLLKGLGASE